ncbi:MAG: AAA family ATPase [Burkholderiales bacterium]|nr:AAA family ATPase [Burkholderiales bacterium]
MKITIKNIGIFEHVEYELGDLNIICGGNNTGKTYATYALYGFLDYWKNSIRHYSPLIYAPISQKLITQLMETGSISIPLVCDQITIDEIMNKICNVYSQQVLPKIFATKQEYFKDSLFLINIPVSELKLLETYDKKWQSSTGNELFQIVKESGKKEIVVTMLVNQNKVNDQDIQNNTLNTVENIIKSFINIAYAKIMFSHTIPDVFIASAERTGAVIFKDELNLDKNALLKQVTQNEEINPNTIVNSLYTPTYALPVRRNIEVVRNLSTIAKNESFISKDYPWILTKFDDLIGGAYKIDKDGGIYYAPKINRVVKKLTMGESSSSVRALLDVGFYLRHLAEKDDLLMIDEPELNLHPENQRRITRLFAILANIGVKIFITTHSDYIIKELNTLIMLFSTKDKNHATKIMHDYGYLEQELINPKKIRVYISQKASVMLPGKTKKARTQVLHSAPIDDFYGVEASSFDKAINEMNKIQNLLVFG